MTGSLASDSRGEQESFHGTLSSVAHAVQATLDGLLPLPQGPERQVVEAMRHGSLNGGKRLRPFLVVQSAGLFGIDRQHSLRAAAALEMVHCYSLVHDDLPAMDNDDLRRGQPTVHKAFDDATAILAGDGLLTRAFEVLADPATHSDPSVRSELCLVLARAAGSEGMVAGQMLDLIAETQSLPQPDIERLQSLKTGCLLGAAAEFGAVLGAGSASERATLAAYGRHVGAAFQIADDLLDVSAKLEDVGKATGKDAAAGKATFISLGGPDHARTQAKSFADQAVKALRSFGPDADLLREAARFAVERRK